MKSAEEIRRHRNDLLTAMGMPCGCRLGGHADQCKTGGKMMKAVTDTLSWVLGENDPMQELVDRIAKDVAEYKQAK